VSDQTDQDGSFATEFTVNATGRIIRIGTKDVAEAQDLDIKPVIVVKAQGSPVVVSFRGIDDPWHVGGEVPKNGQATFHLPKENCPHEYRIVYDSHHAEGAQNVFREVKHEHIWTTNPFTDKEINKNTPTGGGEGGGRVGGS
jgi:hypothetical protein